MRAAIVAVTLFLGLAACSSDNGTTNPDAGTVQRPDATVALDAGTEKVCGEGSQHEQLLNAPTSATAIQKTPTHPPVDGGLP